MKDITCAAPWDESGQARLCLTPATDSTNTDLLTALRGPDGLLGSNAAAAWPHLSALQTHHQRQGRGRGEHTWITPPGTALTISFVLRPLLPADMLGWIPLLAGLAVRDTVADLLPENSPVTAWTKWPNDVLLVASDPHCEEIPGWGRSRKVAGILTEALLPASLPSSAPPQSREEAAAIVVGIGVNVAQEARDLPVPWATSLASQGLDLTPEEVRDRLGAHLASLLNTWERATPAQLPSLRSRLESCCWTLGQQVEVTTPAGTVVGRVLGIQPALILRISDAETRLIQAGDLLTVRKSATQ